MRPNIQSDVDTPLLRVSCPSVAPTHVQVALFVKRPLLSKATSRLGRKGKDNMGEGERTHSPSVRMPLSDNPAVSKASETPYFIRAAARVLVMNQGPFGWSLFSAQGSAYGLYVASTTSSCECYEGRRFQSVKEGSKPKRDTDGLRSVLCSRHVAPNPETTSRPSTRPLTRSSSPGYSRWK